MQRAAPGPPPSSARDPASVASSAMRIRRASAPFSAPYQNLLAAEVALKSDDLPREAAPMQTRLDVVAVAPQPVATKPHHAPLPRASTRASTNSPVANKVVRQSSLVLAQEKKRERTEQSDVIAALHQTGITLSALNEREHARCEQLRLQVEQLSLELTSVNESLAEEKTKNEKITALRKQQPQSRDASAAYLPNIHGSTAAVATATVALQEQAQLEITYQRRILSLENRNKDLIDNNKRLLSKIQQLEKTEVDAGAEINTLRFENTRLATQADTLSSTVASQSSLLIGLRTTVQRLQQDEQNASALAHKLERCQTDLDNVRLREKVQRDEHDRLQTAARTEREMLGAKIVECHRQLQRSEQANDAMEALQQQLCQVETDKLALTARVAALVDQNAVTNAQLHQQEELTNRFLLEKQQREQEVAQRIAELAQRDSALVAQLAQIDSLRALSARGVEADALLRTKQQACDAALLAKDREVDALVQQLVEQQRVADTLHATLAAKDSELAQLRRDVQQLQQLSQDETVQALQLARMKAASHDALRLVENEKLVLHRQIELLQSQLTQDARRCEQERSALAVALEASEMRLQELREANKALAEQAAAAAEALPLPLTTDATAATIVVEPAASSVDPLEYARVQAELARLELSYADVCERFESVDAAYKTLATRKYKTESFQNQVRLLQHENSELSSRLEQLCTDLVRERAAVAARTRDIADLEARVVLLDPSAVALLRSTQASLEKTVTALVEAEASSESAFTCLQCMQLFVEPMTLAPCGHTYCARCLTGFGDVDEPSTIQCKDCWRSREQVSTPPLGDNANGGTDVEPPDAVFPNQALADLTARFVFRQQSLASLTTMCLALRDSFASRSTSAYS